MVCGFVRRGLATSATLAPWTGFVWWSRVGRFVLLGGRVLVRAGFACCHTMRAEPQVQCAPRSTNVGAVCACAQAWNGRDRPNKRLPTAAVTGGGPPASQHRGGQEDFDVVCQRGPTVSVHSRGCSARAAARGGVGGFGDTGGTGRRRRQRRAVWRSAGPAGSGGFGSAAGGDGGAGGAGGTVFGSGGAGGAGGVATVAGHGGHGGNAGLLYGTGGAGGAGGFGGFGGDGGDGGIGGLVGSGGAAAAAAPVP